MARLKKRSNSTTFSDYIAVSICLVFVFIIVTTSLNGTFLEMTEQSVLAEEQNVIDRYIHIIENQESISEKQIQTLIQQLESEKSYNKNLKLMITTGYSKSVYDALNKAGNEEGIPIEVWFPIVNYESRGNPKTRLVNSLEDSRGLFQVNTYVHNADKNKLYDPYYNAKYQMPELKRYMNEAISKGLTGVDITIYVARYGQRPAWKEWIAESIRKSYTKITNVK